MLPPPVRPPAAPASPGGGGPPRSESPWSEPPRFESGPSSVPPLLVLLGVFAVAMLVVRVVFFLLLGVLVRVRHGVDLDTLIVSYQLGAVSYPYDVIVANALAQAVGLGYVAIRAAALHTDRVGDWLRLGPAPPVAFALAVVGMLGLVPLVQLLSTLNAYINLPSFLQELERAQLLLFDRVLSPGDAATFGLVVMTLALSPALFEEVFFRGYVLRQSGRGRTGVGAVVLSALLFALYHGRFGQVLPLLALGLYLGFVARVCGSVWPAVAAHFLYNGGLIVAVTLAPSPDRVPALETWVVIPGTVLTLLAARSLLARRARAVAAGGAGAVTLGRPT
jgi:uncharacterized protein